MAGACAYPDSYYAATSNAPPARPSLAQNLDCDVCVIGAGLTGCSAALNLAERGYDTVLLEAMRVGWGASGRSGGQVIYGYACDMSRLRAEVGRDDARRLWDMSVEAVAIVRERVHQLAIDCDLHDGQAHVAIKPRQENELRQMQRELETEYAYPSLRWLDRVNLGELLGTTRYRAGLYDSNSAYLHPLRYTLGLARAAEHAGARIFECTPAVAIDRGGVCTVRTTGHTVRCRYVLVCGNAYAGPLGLSIERRIMPVSTWIVATEPLGRPRAEALIRNRMAVTDVNFVLDYFRLTGDDRLLFGGRVSYSRLPPVRLVRSIRARMLKVFPGLRRSAVEYAWGGDVAITLNRAVDFGRLDGNVFYAQGFSGHGMALTGLAGRVMAEAVAGTAERFDVFTRIRHRDFPGGRALRTPALVLAMFWYRLRDLL